MWIRMIHIYMYISDICVYSVLFPCFHSTYGYICCHFCLKHNSQLVALHARFLAPALHSLISYAFLLRVMMLFSLVARGANSSACASLWMIRSPKDASVYNFFAFPEPQCRAHVRAFETTSSHTRSSFCFSLCLLAQPLHRQTKQ